MICPSCHSEVPDGSMFCTNCGKKLDTPAPSGPVCPVCGAQVAPGAKFCTNCGNKLEEATETTAVQPEAPATTADAVSAAEVQAEEEIVPTVASAVEEEAPETDVPAPQPASDKTVAQAIPEEPRVKEGASEESPASALEETAAGAPEELPADAPTEAMEDAAPTVVAPVPAPDSELAPDTFDSGADEAVETLWGADGLATPPDEAETVRLTGPTCPSCGAPVDPNAPFCTHCGARLSAPVASIPYEQDASAGATMVDMARVSAVPRGATVPGMSEPVPVMTSAPATPRQADLPPQSFDAPAKKKMSGGKIAAIAVGAVVALALVGGGVWFVLDQQRQQQEAAQQQAAEEAAAAEHAVKIIATAEGWNTADGASRLPVHVVGTASDGTAVNEVQYVDSNGDGLKLRQGDYDFTIAASPIAADGTIYTVPGTTLHVSFESADPSESIDATEQGGFELTPIAALDVTDDQLSTAYDHASKDEEGTADAAALRDAATKRRDDAVAQKEADEKAAAEEAAREARHVVANGFEFFMPEHWDNRVDVDIDGSTVTIRSKKYPRLDLCWIEVRRGAEEAMGDIGTACMGSVSLGEGMYANVYATRWGYTIADLYRRATSDPDDYYSMEEANEIVDLQTGGAITYTQLRDDYVDNGEAHNDLTDNYIRKHIVETIQPTG